MRKVNWKRFKTSSGSTVGFSHSSSVDSDDAVDVGFPSGARR